MNLLAYVHLRNIYGSTGAGRVARQLTEHLAAEPGVSLRVLADKGDYPAAARETGEPWTSFRYHFFAGETSRQQARWYLLGAPSAEHYWPEANLVFCTAESYVPVRRARLAVTLHDAAFFEQGAHAAGWLFRKQQWKWRLLYRTLARKADLFHTVSQFSAERLAHFFPAIASRLRVVHNAVPPRFFAAVSEAGESYLRTSPLAGRPYILLPRGLAHRKNAALVLRAWPVLAARHPELQLVVTSHCDEPYRSQALTLGSRVHLTGFVSDEALRSLYGAAAAVWFPSLYEGFGLPVIEAMACGAPVVASNSSSLPEIAGRAALLVDPKSAGEHIDALSLLLTDSGVRNAYVAAGAGRAREFTWQRSASRLRQRFEEIL